MLDILQKVFYRSNPAREAFVEMCEDGYVQKMTFDSYLYKTVVPGNPLDDVKLLVNTVGSLIRANALRSGKGVDVSFGSKVRRAGPLRMLSLDFVDRVVMFLCAADVETIIFSLYCIFKCVAVPVICHGKSWYEYWLAAYGMQHYVANMQGGWLCLACGCLVTSQHIHLHQMLV